MLPNSEFVIIPWPATSGGANIGVHSDNAVNVCKFYLPSPITVSSMVIRCGVEFVGNFWGFGLYDLDLNLVLDTGPISQPSTVIGRVITAPISPAVTLGSKMYWFAYTCTGIAPSLAPVTSPDIVNSLVSDATTGDSTLLITGHVVSASVAGQLPATLGAITFDPPPGSSICPIIKLQA